MRRNLTLDAIRGIAAAAVVLWHFQNQFTPLYLNGSFAVDLFFVMSGYVVAASYERKLEEGRYSFRGFMLHRLLRFYPLYMVGSLLGLFLAIHFSKWTAAPWSVAQIVAASTSALFMLPTTVPVVTVPDTLPPLFPLNGPAWSLFLEVVINAIYAATWRYWTLRNLMVWFAVSAASVAAIIAIYGSTSIGDTFQTFPGGFARVLFGFPAGVLLFRLARKDLYFGSLGAMVSAAMVLAMMAVPPTVLVGTLMIVVGSPLAIFVAIHSQPPKALHSVSAFLGGASYAMYAVHLQVVALLGHALYRINTVPSNHAPWSGLATIAFLFAVSWALNKLDIAAREKVGRRKTPVAYDPSH